MTTLNATEARSKLYNLIDETAQTHQPIVITGKRDKGIIEIIENKNYTLQSSVNKKTDLLIAEDKDSKSSKVVKAKELNIPIYNFDEFKIKY